MKTEKSVQDLIDCIANNTSYTESEEVDETILNWLDDVQKIIEKKIAKFEKLNEKSVNAGIKEGEQTFRDLEKVIKKKDKQIAEIRKNLIAQRCLRETHKKAYLDLVKKYKSQKADLIKEIESKSISGTYVDGNTYLPHEFKYEQIKIIKESDWQKIKLGEKTASQSSPEERRK